MFMHAKVLCIIRLEAFLMACTKTWTEILIIIILKKKINMSARIDLAVALCAYIA